MIYGKAFNKLFLEAVEKKKNENKNNSLSNDIYDNLSSLLISDCSV